MISIGRHLYKVSCYDGYIFFENANYYKSGFKMELSELAFILANQLPSWQVCETLDHCKILDYLKGN